MQQIPVWPSQINPMDTPPDSFEQESTPCIFFRGKHRSGCSEAKTYLFVARVSSGSNNSARSVSAELAKNRSCHIDRRLATPVRSVFNATALSFRQPSVATGAPAG